MNNNEILSVLHTIFDFCKVNNIDIVFLNNGYTLHDTNEYKLGYTKDIKIIEIFEPFKSLEDFKIYCLESLDFQKNMWYKIHGIFAAIQY